MSHYIDSYSFGSIIVNGKEYNSDIIISDEGVMSDWWREESHLLLPEDLSSINWRKVNALFIGTGQSGMMKVSTELKQLLEDQGVPFIIMRTPVAVQEFNRFTHCNKVGIFHITC